MHVSLFLLKEVTNKTNKINQIVVYYLQFTLAYESVKAIANIFQYNKIIIANYCSYPVNKFIFIFFFKSNKYHSKVRTHLQEMFERF